jgi:hypothetical protein
MTARRGTLWKTSWRQQTSSLGTAEQQMWWFANFGEFTQGGEFYYQQPLVTPAIGDVAPPFWVGAIFGTTAPAIFLDTIIQRALGVPQPSTPSWDIGIVWDPNSLPNLIANAHADNLVAPLAVSLSTPLDPLGANPAPPALIRAVVMMLVVEPDAGGGFRETLWVDGNARQTSISVSAYDPSAGPTWLQPKLGFLNSMAGGNALPTTQEIKDWFSASRYASPFPAAQQIPGKTMDQYDAGNTPGVVPNPLVNLAGGQNAALISLDAPPVPVNLFVQTTFAY